jgi:hypothetical protein
VAGLLSDVLASKINYQSDESDDQQNNDGPKPELLKRQTKIPGTPGGLDKKASASTSRSLDLYQEFGEFLFAFGLVFAGFGFRQLRDVHGAEFRAAHGAEFRFLVEIVWQRFVVHGAGGFRVE